jgi:hypothetical protein
MTLQLLHSEFLTYDENLIFFFISVFMAKKQYFWYFYPNRQHTVKIADAPKASPFFLSKNMSYYDEYSREIGWGGGGGDHKR